MLAHHVLAAIHRIHRLDQLLLQRVGAIAGALHAPSDQGELVAGLGREWNR